MRIVVAKGESHIAADVPSGMKADMVRIAAARYTNVSALVRQALDEFVRRMKEERPEIWDGETGNVPEQPTPLNKDEVVAL